MNAVSPERLDLLQRGWVRLICHSPERHAGADVRAGGGYGVEPAAAYPVFDRVVAAYSEPHRHYHTLEHLGEMFRVVGRLPVRDPGAVQLAVWFHDVVYDPRAADNEARSADAAADWLGPLGVPAETIANVKRLIATTAHFTGDPPSDPDARALLDADLAILGASEQRYARYAADIRAEYAWVPDDAYRTGRAAVLESFLARPRLYFADILHAEGDAPARRNLRAELAALGTPR